jgi:hypothetical protein
VVVAVVGVGGAGGQLPPQMRATVPPEILALAQSRPTAHTSNLLIARARARLVQRQARGRARPVQQVAQLEQEGRAGEDVERDFVRQLGRAVQQQAAARTSACAMGVWVRVWVARKRRL